jgi:periplasmic protein CpxP/Spy
MNRIFTATLLVSAIASGAALAQSSPTNSATVNSSPNPPAIAPQGVDSQTIAAPVPGANSFTEAQARDRLAAHGYTDVTDLKLDDQSIWRGKAMKNGASVKVALDYQGNIVSQ